MVTLDAIEQLHAAALQPEHADSVADLGPFGIEIVAIKSSDRARDFEPRCLGMLPVELSPRASATALVSCIALPEK